MLYRWGRTQITKCCRLFLYNADVQFTEGGACVEHEHSYRVDG